MQEFIAVIYTEPILLRLALLWLCIFVIDQSLRWLGHKQTKWTSRTTEGKEQRLRARKIIIYETYE